MKFKLENVGGFSNLHGPHQRLLCNLKGEDDSHHSIWVEVPHGHAENMTIKQIEDLAIQKARDNFSKC